MNSVWNKQDPVLNKHYICRLENGDIKLCEWEDKDWFHVFGFDSYKPQVVEWMVVPE
jgi:hypothetical protein